MRAFRSVGPVAVISINVTLIFSLTRYEQVMTAFLDGMEQAHRAGHELANLGSVASFFVSRLDTEVDTRLAEIDPHDVAGVRGQAAIANARPAYQRYEQMVSSSRWQALQAAGARPQRPLCASTSTKDPNHPDTRYVVELVAPGVVNTMPEATLRAVADHGDVPSDSVHGYYRQSQAVLDRLRDVGVDYDDVVTHLEEDGITKFDAAWDHLADELKATLTGRRDNAEGNRAPKK